MGRIEQVGTADEVYDTPNSPFVYGFIGESSSLPVKVENGEVWFADRPIGLSAPNEPSGDATLFFRPHDVELLDGCSGCIAGTVAASRRVAGTRRVELEIGGGRERIEIELPVGHPATQKSRVALRRLLARLQPARRKEVRGVAALRRHLADFCVWAVWKPACPSVHDVNDLAGLRVDEDSTAVHHDILILVVGKCAWLQDVWNDGA
jgi:hypothetical protein